VRAGTVLSVIWNQERKAAGFTDEEDCHDTSRAIDVGVRALAYLIEKDRTFGADR